MKRIGKSKEAHGWTEKANLHGKVELKLNPKDNVWAMGWKYGLLWDIS